jgi:hypothetical protein
MTQAILDALRPYCESPPDDLVSHFAGDCFPNDPELSINILSLPSAINYTAGIHRHAILGAPFGLIALEDANNSNPYCYVTKGPTAGSVMYLCHDGDSRIAFSSLRGFMAAIDTAIANRTRIDDLPRDPALAGLDRSDIVAHVARLAEGNGAIEEICVLVPLLSTTEAGLVNVLSQHPDFFVREVVAHLLVAYPNIDLFVAAERLAADPHPQVARPGKRALSAVNRMKWNV